MEATLASKPLTGKKAISDGVMGMIFLIVTEAMFFAGLISAYIVNRAGAALWPPYGQPRLPVEITAVNTLVLLSSAIVLYLFSKKHKFAIPSSGKHLQLLLSTILLGGTFLTIQGIEWAKLIGYGLTTSSSLYGSFFYVIIGVHAVHAIAGLIILFYLLSFVKNSKASSTDISNKIAVCSIYWYFVVGIWPILYVLVYLV